MNRLYIGVGPLLAGMVAKGLMTLEQLDVPTPRWMDELELMTQYRLMSGKPPPEWRNTARDWIEAHPADWVALQALHADAKARREEYRQSRRGVVRLAEAPATAARGWVDSDDLVEFEP